MVLVVIGLFGLLIIQSQKLLNYYHENVPVYIYFENSIPEQKLIEKAKELEKLPHVASTKYLNGDEEAIKFKEVFQQDFIEGLGFNPIPSSIEVSLKPQQLEGSFDAAIEQFKKIEGVNDVQFNPDLINQINQIKKKAGISLIAIALLLLIVSLILVNNAIKLEVYARRFTIKSMQLIGATQWFIIRPFVLKSLIITLISAVLAIIIIWPANSVLANLLNTQDQITSSPIYHTDFKIYSILFAVILLIGLCIVVPSTYFATKKYLRLKIEDLY